MLYKSPSNKRKILSATILLTLLVSALAGTVLIESGEADPMPAVPQVVNIKVQSPIKK
jgi:hypothetical protein